MMNHDKNNTTDDGDEFFLEMSDPELDESGGVEDAQEETIEINREVLEEEASAEVAQLRQELQEAIEARDNFKDQLFRKAADLENYRKRAQREREEMQKYGNEKFALELLPVLDNMERALNAIQGDEATSPLREGVEMVFKQLVGSLQRFGVVGFDSKGTPFEPQKHEAIQQVDTDDVPSGTVVDEFQRGYFIHDRLLRPAMVSVAKNSQDE